MCQHLQCVQGRRAAAEHAVRVLYPRSDVDATIGAIASEVRAGAEHPAPTVLQLLSNPVSRAQLHVGVGLQIWQQLCGINTVMYFTPVILQMAGFVDRRQALLWACLPAACNMLGSVVSAMLNCLQWHNGALL